MCEGLAIRQALAFCMTLSKIRWYHGSATTNLAANLEFLGLVKSRSSH